MASIRMIVGVLGCVGSVLTAQISQAQTADPVVASTSTEKPGDLAREEGVSKPKKMDVPSGVYRPLLAHDSRLASLETIDCLIRARGCIEKHGTFKRDPYFYAMPIINDDYDLEGIRLISNGTLDINFVKDASKEGQYSYTPGNSDTPALLIVDSPKCQYQPKCFEVRDMPAGVGIANGAYQQTMPMEKKKLPQIWSDVFDHRPANYLKALRCYDITQLDSLNFEDENGHCRTGMGWFELPADESTMYESVPDGEGVNRAIPFGFKFVNRLEGWGGSRAEMLENSKDENDARMKSVGWKTGVNLIIVDFSVHHNKTTQERKESMYEEKVTFSEFKSFETQYALVLDMHNLRLRDNFKKSVRSLIDTGDYTYFIETWGTHVPYATTFGRRGEQTSQFSEQQVQSLASQSVNVSTGVAAGISMPLEEFGLPGSIGMNAGLDNASAREHALRMKQVLGKNFESYHCIGGMSCHGAEVVGAGVEPVLLDLLPVSELLGPPFILFQSPAPLSDEDEKLFAGIDKDEQLRVRDGLREAIAAYAFATGESDRPSATNVQEYVRLSGFAQTGQDCYIISYKDGKQVREPYSGGPQNCKITNLQVWNTDLEPTPFQSVGNGLKFVSPKRAFGSNQQDQYKNSFFGIKGDVEIKDTPDCLGGPTKLEGVAWGSLTVNVPAGDQELIGYAAAALSSPMSDARCAIEIPLRIKVEIGGAGKLLGAD